MSEPAGKPSISVTQRKAKSAYQTASSVVMGDREVMAEAFRVMIRDLGIARDFLAAKNFEEMHNTNTKTIRILDVLRSELLESKAHEEPEAKAATLFLLNTYTAAIRRIALVLSHENPVGELEALIEEFKPIYRAWLPLQSEAPAQMPAPANGQAIG